MNFSTIHLRVEAGWPIEDILSTEKHVRPLNRKICLVEGCSKGVVEAYENEQVDSQYCHRHYRRYILYGSPLKCKSDVRWSTLVS